MVFEAVVVEFLNKFLKQYVENLDSSQLKIGIWGGDVMLNNLKIKTTLFDDLNLPVRVKWGKLGKFVMKIPWKNLYASQVVINIQDLLIVVVPNTEFKYDPLKEEKWEFERKQAKLKAVEEAKKRELETEPSRQNDGFIEKLLSQIIKNLQIVIKNVHIRYEDKSTIPGFPFSVGVTMSNLSAQTTVNDPTTNFSKLMKENQNFICKVVNLEGLAIYWNSNSELFSDLPQDRLINDLIESIPRDDYKPKDFMYLFGPLSASAFLRLNPKPEVDGSNFTIPKIFVNVHLKEIELAVTHNQFCDAMSFLQSYQRLSAAAKYKKYRPVGIPVIGYAKQWWKFAYSAVVEDIVRRRREWCWENIKQHRIMCRRYSEIFKLKLNSKKLPMELENELQKLEKKLNVFNLVLIREQVYVEVERDKCKQERKSTGWFSNWFGYGTETESDSNEDVLVKKIQSVMSSQEKEKLYKAIGYEESAPPTNYPITFVEVQHWFHLDEMKTTVYDDRGDHCIPVMTISVKSVRIEFEQRPSAFAMKFVMIIGKFQVTGKQEKDHTYPELVTSNCRESESLIEVLYETKPLKATCDQRIIVNARPLRIIFHADTINFVRDVFTTESTEEIEKIVAATSASLPTFQRITSLGLQYAIEKQTVLEVKVSIMSSHLIIPYGGIYHPNKEMLVLMLGKLDVETEENPRKEVSVKKLHLEGTTDEEIFSAVVSASYTKFNCHLRGVQILFQLNGEDWVAASQMTKSSPLQFLEPTNLEVTIKKSLVMDDARIPKMIIEGKLPSLAFNFSEERFVSFVALACSIPMKEEKSTTMLKKKGFASNWSVQSLGTQLESKLVSRPKDTVMRTTEYVQGIDLVGHFEMNEFVVNVSKSKELSSGSKMKKEHKAADSEENFLNLRIMKLEVEFTSKTFETINLLKLGGIDFKQCHKSSFLPFVTTKGLEHDYYLFVVEYINLDTKIPDFYTTRNAIINRLTLNITPLNVLLNKEALLAQLAFITNVQRRVDLVRENCKMNRLADAGKIHREVIYEETFQNDKKVLDKGKRFRKKGLQKEVIDLFLQASLDEIDVVVEFEGEGLAEFSLKGGSVDISTRKSYTNVDVNIREVVLLDLNPMTKHKRIVGSLEKKTLSSKLTLFNKQYFGSENSLDMSIDAEVGGIQCTFVNVFFSRVFMFLNAFQSQIETLKEGATIAAMKAKENVVKAFQNAAQICMNLKITAPLLLIPESSISLETIALDMGVMTLKNSITELDYNSDNERSSKPLIDISKLHLQNLTITRCTLKEDFMSVEHEDTFLVPVTFDLTIKRNLSRGWFRVIPELEILARLTSIHLTLTHEDLCSIAHIIQENLKEGQEVAGPHGSMSPVKAEPKASAKLKSQTIFHHETQLLETIPSDDDIHKTGSNFYTVVKFMFFMDSFIFDAVTKHPVEGEEKLENSGLARFVLEAMSLKGRLFSNNSIHTSIMLVSCLLDDTRPGKEGRLTRLMERTDGSNTSDYKEEENRTNSMIEVIYQKKDEDTFIDVRVYKFTLILSMDFLQKLGMFFTLEDGIATGAGKGAETQAVDHKKAEKPKEKEKEVENSEFRPPTLTINLRLEKPDIFVVENMDSINTDALVFHTEMIVKYRFAGARKIISGTLSDIELYSCCFNPSKRPHTLNQVIKPFTISLAGSTPEDSGLHVDICLTDIFININPSTVDLLSKCYAALLRDSTLSEENAIEKDYTNLWDVQSFQPSDYWFLKTEEGMDALTSLRSSSSLKGLDSLSADEIALIAIPSIKISLEGLSSSGAQPLLLLDMGFQMQCYNWSQKATILNSLSVQMQYYNKTLSAWEPLIEPNETISDPDKKHSYIPWELNCSITYGDEGELEGLRPPKVQVTLSCTEILQLTITKTCLEVLKNAADTYSRAVRRHVVNTSFATPPYVIKNETGLVAELLLEKSSLQVCRGLNNEYKIVRLESNSEVELQNAITVPPVINKMTSFSLLKKETRLFLKFPISGKQIFELPLGLSCKRYYPFPVGELGNREVWGLVSDVSVIDNLTTVVLQSFVKIINYFNEPINVHCLSDDGKAADYIGTVEGNSSYSLPLHVVFNPDKKLFFSVKGYSLSTEPFDWTNLKEESSISAFLQCSSKLPESQDPFFIQVIGETEQIYYANTSRKTASSIIFKVHLQPTLKLFNSLSVPLIICFQGSAKEKLLQPGNNIQITNAEPGTSTITLRIDNYLEKEWSCKETILENPSEFLVWKFVSYNGLTPETLNLGVHVTYKRKTVVYTIYCPFFMVNKTEHLLSYKFDHSSTVFYHPGNLKIPLMFSPTSRKFFSKKSACLQVKSSEWSDKFPVDVAGSGGTVTCEDPSLDITYKISVSISLTYNSLTKIVVFTPFYVIVNSADYTIELQEPDFPHRPWLEIIPDSCVPFWPRSQAQNKTIQIRPKGSDSVSPPFTYDSTDACLLKLSHKFGGIFVNIQATQSGNYITFSSYEPGQAPALIINYSAKVVKLYESGIECSIILKPFQQVFHAWMNPSGERSLILMNPKNFKDVISLNEDSDGIVYTSRGERVRYVSFLDGLQRILLFTDDQELLRTISSSRLAMSGIEVIFKIQGIGLSLINNISLVEILYLGFVSSGISWESRKVGKTRFKPMKEKDKFKLEKEYQKYLMDVESKVQVNPVVTVSDDFVVDFERMEIIVPSPKEMRRTFEPGLWAAFREIDDQLMLHVKINKIQVDNQLQDCIFPVVLAPVPPPKTVAAIFQGPRPFLELSVVKIAADRRGVEQYKYFKTLIQEFHVKLDIGFIRQIYLFLAAEEISDEQQKINCKKDMEFAEKPLKSHIEIVSSTEQKNFYELLHLPPLKIHFSFSLAGKIESNDSLPPAFSVLLQSLGVTLTDIHDVIFRLSYLERKSVFLTNSQLVNEIVSHYYGQIIRQAYVLLLGLDVIGNPFGLIVGIGQGVEAFFYEPFQGMIQGPSEFGTGMAIGCKSLLGHTVGSAAGTLGKLTETLGKGLAVLSLDKEYQMQRMADQHRQENIHALMARGGRGLVMGVVEGVTGVVKKPIKGAKEEGVGGFFKGVGKGMMGLVTRPVTGVVDFASTSFNAVKKASVQSADSHRLRPPRFFRDDTLVEPYNLKDAQGNAIFYSICKLKYCATDKYEYHLYLRGNEIVVLTNKRIILAELSEVFETWQEHLAITWKSMPERPRCHTKGVALTMPQRGGHKEKSDVKVLLIDNPSAREEICKKMIELYNLENHQTDYLKQVEEVS